MFYLLNLINIWIITNLFIRLFHFFVTLGTYLKDKENSHFFRNKYHDYFRWQIYLFDLFLLTLSTNRTLFAISEMSPCLKHLYLSICAKMSGMGLNTYWSL